MVRIDERLVHGQVAMIWSKHLGIDRIIVVNDKAASDPILTSTLKMAAPSSVKVIVLSKEKAKVLLADPRMKELQSLIVVNSPEDALFVVENAKEVSKVNIGNYGKASGSKEAKTKLNDNVLLDDKDKENLKKIIELGFVTQYQLVPDQSITDLSKVL